MTSELFFYGIKVTAIGVGIVFAVLYLIQLLLIVLGLFLKVTKKKSNTAQAQEVSQVHVVEPEPVEEPNFGVLVAIFAALAAMMGDRPVNIISIRKDIPSTTPWQQAARHSTAERRHN